MCHKHLYKNEIPCKAVCNRMPLDPIPDELKNSKKKKKIEKVPIFRRTLFKKITIMHGKGEFFQITGGICNIPIQAPNICNILPS